MRPCLIGLIVLSAVLSGIGTTDLNETITVIPSVVVHVALINDSTFFNCSTTSVDVEWFFEPDQYKQVVIYSHGTVNPNYVDRSRIQNYTNSFGNHFNLILENVTENDAGLYICRVPKSEERKEVHLTVIETQPVCKSNLNVDGLIGPNSCSIKPDTVQLSCSVTYISNQVPELQWTKMGENMTINSSICLDSGNIYTCNLTIETELQMEGDSYICRTTQSRTRQYNCTSDVFRIIYVFGEHTELSRTVNDKVNCSVNSSSLSCTFTWIFDNGTTNWTESHEPVMEFKIAGRFICQAICVIRNDSCTFTVMTVNVSVKASPQDNDNRSSTAETALIVGIVVGVVGATFIFGIVISICVYTRIRRRPIERAEAEQVMLEHNEDASNEQDPPERDHADVQEIEASNEVDHVDQPEGDAMFRSAEYAGGTADDDNSPRKFRPQADENRGQRVRGLTILNDELFVAYFMSNIIEAFTIASGRPTQYRKVVVDGLMYPGTMAACATNSCLYVIDKIASSNKKIFKFEPNGEVMQNWNTDDDDYGRISVSDDGNVVMTVYDKHKVKIYSSEGKLLTTIGFTNLSGAPNIAHIFHAIDVTGGNFIISHGSYQSDVHRVCMIDAKGNLLLTPFGSEKGSDNQHLNAPAYLAKRNDESILVADQNNHRIILLNSDLTFKTVLFTKEKDDVSLPEVMHIYKKTLLFLGCNETVKSGGYVVVLRLKQ